MKRFILRFLSFLAIPFAITAVILVLYIQKDPYMDFKDYPNYSWTYSFQILGDFSTKKLLRSKVKYNSFIFGSSRTTSLYACYLEKKISDSRFFHYSNWSESIGGIYARLRLLDSLGYKLDNVVMYFDTDCTFEKEGTCHSTDHYLVTGENKYKYHYNHFHDYVTSKNLDNYKILLGYRPSADMTPNWVSDPEKNDSEHQCSDEVLNEYGNRTKEAADIKRIDSLKKSGFLYSRSAVQKWKEKQISAGELEILQKMKSILDKHHSKYYIIISPLYDQMKFAEADAKIINETFANHVYDFSGINAITANEYNYPDRKHFVHRISKEMMDSVLSVDQHL